MGFLERAIRNGISKGIGDAVGKAISNAVEPKATEYANKVAAQYEQAAKDISDGAQSAAQATAQTAQTAQPASKPVGGLEAALANLQSSMEGYATQMSKNMKICPKCEEPTTADKKFCPSCGAKLPELTVAEGAVCPKCGKQNTIGTKFCQECGEKLPAAIEEEKFAAESDAAVLTQWGAKLSAYPVWNCGGKNYEIEEGEGYLAFYATFDSDAAAIAAVKKYREVVMQSGFKQAGEYPSIGHLYKKVGTVCYHVDTEHCFEGDSNCPMIGFSNDEPTGGYDYVKPAPQKTPSLRDLFKL